MAKKPNGVEYVTDNVKELFAKYDPDGVGILRAHAPMQNRKGQGRFLLLSRPDDFEVVFRHEGKYPTRYASCHHGTISCARPHDLVVLQGHSL